MGWFQDATNAFTQVLGTGASAVSSILSAGGGFSALGAGIGSAIGGQATGGTPSSGGSSGGFGGLGGLGGLGSFFPGTGAGSQITPVSGNPTEQKSNDKTIMYVGGGVVLLGILYVIMKGGK